MGLTVKKVGALVVIALLATTCGGSPTVGSGDRVIDICSMVTQAEAASFLGGPADPPAPPDSLVGSEATCAYQSPGAQTRILLQVYDGEHFYSGDNAELHPDAQPVSGLGQEGYLEPGGVGFLQNDWAVFVSRISGPITDDTLLAVARKVSERLP